jgi:hypothetical protein
VLHLDGKFIVLPSNVRLQLKKDQAGNGLAYSAKTSMTEKKSFVRWVLVEPLQWLAPLRRCFLSENFYS